MNFRETIGTRGYCFDSLGTLVAKASSRRSGDELAGIAATSEKESVAARMALVAVPLRAVLGEALIPYADDEMKRLIIDEHSTGSFAPISHPDSR